MLFAAYLLFSARRKNSDFFRLATYSLITDILFLSMLVLALGELEGGIGILLVFTSAVAAVLLPLRIALFLASIASLTIIGSALWNYYTGVTTVEPMLNAGLYGVTAMVSAVMTHQLAYWARDYRLIAEKQRETLSELEQVNELIIRRMRTGVIAVDHEEQGPGNERIGLVPDGQPTGSPAPPENAVAQAEPDTRRMEKGHVC